LDNMTQTRETPAITLPGSPERLAWGVLLISFAVFCGICIATTLGVHYFFFTSTVSMDIELKVGRGIASIVTKSDSVEEAFRGESGPRSLAKGTTIKTDVQTQAVLSFYDTSDDNGQLVAAITVKRNTDLTFNTASQPRFEWGTGNYFIRLDNLAGELDVFVAENLPRTFRLDIRTDQESWISISSGGRYSVSATGDQIRLVNREGSATLFAPDPRINRSIPETMEGNFVIGESAITVIPATVELLQNSTFEVSADTPADEEEAPETTIPVGWACTNEQDALPRGAYGSEILQGRPSMRLTRSEGATSHGETRCIQPFHGQNGVDVSAYTYLSLRATFYIDYQSLSTCGIDGSECPLMLIMDYLDANGIGRTWYHGFYAWTDSQVDYPLRCSSCAQDNERISEKTWYTYESGNLIAELPPDLRPSNILVVRFRTSGHQYNVYVGEVSLLAR
jgi:hypothetical protein